jgi:Xaa-Pro aminopeptidase
MATDPYAHIRGYCAHTQPINSSEFISRQQRLASLLLEQNAIYVAEPGANGLYFANISSTMWHLSERPLLFVLSPGRPTKAQDTSDSDVSEITVLTPKFESTRAKLLSIPAAGNTAFIEWAEDVNPFETLVGHLHPGIQTIYVDEKMRAFVWQGLRDAFPNAKVEIASPAIRGLRERKSPAEVELLRCANEVRDCIMSTKGRVLTSRKPGNLACHPRCAEQT